MSDLVGNPEDRFSQNEAKTNAAIKFVLSIIPSVRLSRPRFKIDFDKEFSPCAYQYSDIIVPVISYTVVK